MLKKILLVLLVVIIAILGYAATKPDTFKVERSLVMDAEPAEIFAQINDFHNWNAWSPYMQKDPEMTSTYSGEEEGVGAVYEWSGNMDVGSGRMEITESTPPTKVAVDLHFLSPFDGTAAGAFTMEERDDMTNVTWSIEG